MDIGRITEKELRQALGCLRRGRSLEGNALLDAGVVVTRVRQEGFVDTPESRGWALSGLLETVIHANLSEHRGQQRRGAAAGDVRSGNAVRAEIGADFASGQPDREAWSCLYYRYFAAHDLQIAELAAIARPSSRNGRKHIWRRIELGLRMLTSILREGELAAAVDLNGRGPETTSRPDGAAEPAEPAAPRQNLPAAQSTFVGRERELEAIVTRLEAGRLVTLTGPAGSGKTRLALETARRLVGSYHEGTWFVELADLIEPGLVGTAIADCLAAGGDERQAPLAAVIDAVGSRRILCVLDNCEHLVQASAEAAQALLRGCPNARILATSREPLALDGEVVWPLEPLAVPAPAERGDVDAVAGSAAVQLFVVRAGAADPRFRLDAASAGVVAELVARLDGLPLALELAAARVRTMPIADMLIRLDERFHLLDHGRRTVGPRHRTLWAAIDWSYNLLDSPEQTLLRRIAPFKGGWTLAAAEKVCSDGVLAADQILEGLTQLAEKSLVLIRFAGDGGSTRYDLLESIRDFAVAKCREAGEYAAQRGRHLAWCVALAEEASGPLTGPDQAEWLERLTLEVENLRQALAWAAAEPQAAEDGLRLAALLAPYWRLRGRPAEGREWIRRLLDTPAGTGPVAVRAQALAGAGALAFQQGDYAAARAHHQESLAIRRELGDEEQVAESLRHLGNVADESGDYEAALACYGEALAIWRRTANAWGEAATLNNLGLVALRRGDYAAAAAHLDGALARFTDQGTDWAVAITLSNLGDVALARGEGSLARRRFADSLTVARRLDDQEGIAYSLTGMAHAECLLGHHAAARRLLGESLIYLERMGSKQGVAEWLEVAAVLDAARGRAEGAVQIHAAVGALRAAIESPLPPKDRAAKQAALSALEQRLGEQEFESLWLVGTTLRWQDAATLAMRRDDDHDGSIDGDR